jgi:hypothetical protein
MSETRWLAEEDPGQLLHSVYAQIGAAARRGEPADPERLRLFACACCRRTWQLQDEDHRRSVEMLERHARAPDPQLLREARKVCGASARAIDKERDTLITWERASHPDVSTQLTITARSWASHAVRKAAKKPSQAAQAFLPAGTALDYMHQAEAARRARETRSSNWRPGPWCAEEQRVQVALLRDVFGNPYRRSHFDPAWLAWDGGTIERLAQGIDTERAYDRLTVLGDALEEAGCADEQILEHCRGPGPHTLGCWVVDALIGRK